MKYSQSLIALILFMGIQLLSLSCGGGTTEPTPDPPAPIPTVEVSGSVNQNEIGGEGLRVVSAWDGSQSLGNDGSFTANVSEEAPQLLMVVDTDGELRALSLSLPDTTSPGKPGATRSPSGGSFVDALSTLKSLIALSPGVYDPNPFTLLGRLTVAVNTEAFSSALNHLKNGLPDHPLGEVIGDAAFQQDLETILSVLRGDPGPAPESFLESEQTSIGDPSNVAVTLTNKAYRWLSVYRRDIDQNGEVLEVVKVATGFDCMKSAVPLSWGSLFTWSFGEASSLQDHVDLSFPEGAAAAEYWLMGPGFGASSPTVPAAIDADVVTPWGLSIFDYIVTPVLSLVTGVGAKELVSWGGYIDVVENVLDVPEVWDKVGDAVRLDGVARKGAIIDAAAMILPKVAAAVGSGAAASTTIGTALIIGAQSVGAASAGLSAANLTLATSYWAVMNPVERIVERAPSQGSVNLVTPNGGEEWIVDEPQMILWTSSCTGHAAVSFSSDGGETWANVSPALDCDAEQYEWTPTTPTQHGRIKIWTGADTEDVSDADFTVSVFRFMAPEKEARLNSGETATIAWETRRTTATIDLEYSNDGGSSWVFLVEDYSNTGQYEWNVPELCGDTALLRISDASGAYAPHTSQAFQVLCRPLASFTVSPQDGTLQTMFQFDASGSADLEDELSELEFRWNWESDGSFDTGWSGNTASEHRYNQTGTITITLEVRDTDGLVDTTTRTIMVRPDKAPPTACFTVDKLTETVDYLFQFDASCTEDNEDEDSALQYDWDWDGDGQYEVQNTGDWTETHQFATAGVYDVVLRVIDTDSVSDKDTIRVTVTNPEPVAVTVEPGLASVQVSGTEQFTATVTGSANTLVTWSVDEGLSWGTIDTSGFYTAPATVPSPATATVRATSVADHSKSGTATVTILSSSPAPTDFVLVPHGSFTMGDGVAYCGTNEYPVELTEDFYLGQTEVTNQQYIDMLNWAWNQNPKLISATSSTVTDAMGSSQALVDLDDSDCEIRFTGSGFALRDAGHGGNNGNHPVKEVTWYGAASYCDWLSLKAGLAQAYDHGTWACNGGDPYRAKGYRLPTDAEWEYAAQYNNERIYPWGNQSPTDSLANYGGNEGWTTEVGIYPAEKTIDGKGLYDMAGNVWEWCNDWHRCAANPDAQDPPGPTGGTYRLLRGGSWYNDADGLRCAFRGYNYPASSSYGYGFRVARTVNP